MSIRIKVQGGTLADKFLCESCESGSIMSGRSMGETWVRCTTFGVPDTVPFRIVKCTRYAEKDSTNLRKMKQDAYYVYKSPSGGVHLLTLPQLDDFHFTGRIDRQDATAHPKPRRRVQLANPKS